MGEGELQRWEIGIGFIGEGYADEGPGGRGRGGCRDSVLVDVWDGGVILGEDCEYDGGGACGEVVECVEGEGSEEEGEQDRCGDCGEREG